MKLWDIKTSPTRLEISKLVYGKAPLYSLGSKDDIQQLALDIQIHGQLKEIYVAKIGNVIMVLDGQRRCEALKLNLEKYVMAFMVQIEEKEIPLFQVSANMYRQKSTQEIIEEVLIVKSKIERHQGKKQVVISNTETQDQKSIVLPVVNVEEKPPTAEKVNVDEGKNVQSIVTKSEPAETPKKVTPPTTTQQAIDLLDANISARNVEKVERIIRISKKYPESKIYESYKNGTYSLDKAEKIAAEIEKRYEKRKGLSKVIPYNIVMKSEKCYLYNKSNWDMSEIEDESIDFTFTSPPYYQQILYDKVTEIGQEQTVEEFIESLIKSFKCVYKKTKKTGNLVVNIKGTNHLLKSFNVEQWFVIKMAEIGWYLRDTLIWNKKGVGRLSGNRERMPENGYEPLFWFVKSKDYYYAPIPKFIPNTPITISNKIVGRVEKDGLKVSDKTFLSKEFESFTNVINETDFLNVINASTSSQANSRLNKIYGSHPAPFPTSLPLLPLLMLCPENGRVLDCFLGRGAGLVAPMLLGHTCYGYEIDEAFFKQSQGLLAEVERDMIECQSESDKLKSIFNHKFSNAA